MNDKWPKSLFLVLTDCTDLTREDEFNDWYNNVHLVDLATAHGLTNSVRYRNLRPKEGTPGYLALYDLFDRDPREVIREILAGDADRSKQGRMLDCVKMWFGSTFERIDP